MLNRVGANKGQNKKAQLVRRLMDQGFDLQCQAIRCLKQYLKFRRDKDAKSLEIQKKIASRFMNKAHREMGQALRMLRVSANNEREKERLR